MLFTLGTFKMNVYIYILSITELHRHFHFIRRISVAGISPLRTLHSSKQSTNSFFFLIF